MLSPSACRAAALLACTAIVAGCRRDQPAEEKAPPPDAPAVAGRVPSTGGSVYEVRIARRGDAPAFEPATITARRGDVIRFVLADSGGGSGVSFPRAGNPAGASLPSPSPLMRQPGQVYEVPVDLPPGSYAFVSLPPGPRAASGTLAVAP